MSTIVSEQEAWAAVAEVCDPEIPVVSLVDLGVVRAVEVSGAKARVEILPTFLGCPALGQMRLDIAAKLAGLGLEAQVEVNSRDSWGSDMITPAGREALRRAGLAPPRPSTEGVTLLQLQGPTPCPYCDSTDTKLENLFGPTPCRSLRYCNSCRQPFEQFKTL